MGFQDTGRLNYSEQLVSGSVAMSAFGREADITLDW
jgi:hypothetical protein